jgi:hypothetical protein
MGRSEQMGDVHAIRTKGKLGLVEYALILALSQSS